MQTKRRAPEEVAITDGRKIARELFGLFLIFWGLLVLLSLVSFDQNDPSINHAVSNPAIVKNYAGLFGAYLSGLLVDIFGFAALVWPLVFLAWGAGCVSTWFTMPWWRWFGFTLLAACLISLGAAWNLGIGDVRGGGMLGMSLYTKFTTLFSPVGSSLIWLFLLFISLEMAFGIAWIALIRKGWALLREQLSGTPFSLDDLPERLSKVSMPKVALPKIGLPHKDKKAEGETAADVIALFDIHDEEERPAPKREEPLSMDPPFSLTPEETTAAPKKDAGDPLKLWEPPSEHDTFDFQPEEPRAGTGTFAPQVNIHLASPTDAAARAVNLLAGENPLLALTIPETQPAPRGLRRNRKFNPCSRMRRSSKLRFSLQTPRGRAATDDFLRPGAASGHLYVRAAARCRTARCPVAASAAAGTGCRTGGNSSRARSALRTGGSGNVSGSGPNRAAPHRRTRGNGSRRSETDPAQTLLSHAFAGPAPAAAAERFPALAGSAGGTERRPDELPRRIQYSGELVRVTPGPVITLLKSAPPRASAWAGSPT
ncbi:MAG: DNA translocase FtsK 4TM domain-containing protein [Bilophila wadsworthia]